MSNDRDDAQGRHETTPSGQPAGEHPDRWQSPTEGTSGTGATAADRAPTGPPPAPGGQDQQYGATAPYDQPPYGQPYGQAPYGQAPYGQAPYGQAPQDQARYGQAPYDPSQYGQAPYDPSQYGQAPYDPAQYGQNPYAAASYASAPYGGSPYGQSPYGGEQPARPGTVITSAVLGLVHAAFGLLVTALFLAGGAIIDDLVDALEDSDPDFDTGTTSSGIEDARAVLVVLALLALAWTVVMIWGSVLALRGRSRVLLLVGSSIAVGFTGLLFLGGLVSATSDPGEDGQAGGIVFLLVLFLAALAMLVLLCLRSAAQFFAAHRQRRELLPR
jgi:hypothetical protein